MTQYKHIRHNVEMSTKASGASHSLEIESIFKFSDISKNEIYFKQQKFHNYYTNFCNMSNPSKRFD